MIHYRESGIDSSPFIGYIDTLSAIVLVFVVITAFTAISLALSKKVMLDSQKNITQGQAAMQAYQEKLRAADQEIAALRTELQRQQERLQTAGYQHVQEIPNRLEWREAVLTKQVLENTGWAQRMAELPLYAEWQQANWQTLAKLRQMSQSEHEAAASQQQAQRYREVLTQAGYADIAEIPPKGDWEQSQQRLKSYQALLEEAGFQGNIDTLYSFLQEWNKIILEMKRVFKVDPNAPQQVLRKLERLESLQKKVVIPVEQGSIFFSFGEVKIQGEFQQMLDAHIEEARAAIQNGVYDLIQIEGHTDRVPVRSDNPRYQDNWELSTARARAVAQYFIARGIPPQNLAVVGHSEFKPKVAGDTPAERAQNRRIEIVFLNTSLLNLGVQE